jgi:hypothetical protein
MKTKRFVVAALAALNAVLLLLLIGQAAPMPAAMAQAARAGGAGYVCATARAAGRSYEVLHMIDLATRKLHSFYPDKGKLIFTAAPRDLDKDFGK